MKAERKQEKQVNTALEPNQWCDRLLSQLAATFTLNNICRDTAAEQKSHWSRSTVTCKWKCKWQNFQTSHPLSGIKCLVPKHDKWLSPAMTRDVLWRHAAQRTAVSLNYYIYSFLKVDDTLTFTGLESLLFFNSCIVWAFADAGAKPIHLKQYRCHNWYFNFFFKERHKTTVRRWDQLKWRQIRLIVSSLSGPRTSTLPADVLDMGSRKKSKTENPSAFTHVSCVSPGALLSFSCCVHSRLDNVTCCWSHVGCVAIRVMCGVN